MTDPSYLFVYGTLRSGAGPESSRLAGKADPAGAGRVRGSLFQLDGHPGMVPAPNGDEWVTGELYRMDEPSSVWPALDEYEGCGPDHPPPREFERRIVQVTKEDGTSLNAWAYVYCLETSGRPRIHSGDYLQRLDSSHGS